MTPAISGSCICWVSNRTSSCDRDVTGAHRQRRSTQEAVVSTRCWRDGANHPSGLVLLSKRAGRCRKFPRRRRRNARRWVKTSWIVWPRCAISSNITTTTVRMRAPVTSSTVSCSRTRARPVPFDPGSACSRNGCRVESSCSRSTNRMVNGTIRCTRARPRSSINRARFSEHGMSGLLLLSNTNTAISVSFALTGLVTLTLRPISPRECLQPAPACAAAGTFGALPFASMIPTL